MLKYLAQLHVKASKAENALLRSFGSTRSSQDDPKFIILNPVQAGLVKIKPRKALRKKPTNTTILRHPSYINSFSEEHEPESVVRGIDSQRPETTSITDQRYQQISRGLIKGFKKDHLTEYLRSQRISPAVYRNMTKKKIAEYIMAEVWQTSVREDKESDTSVSVSLVENVIDLSEEEFALVLGNNGRLLREWSKSGAKISILPARFQIIVNSSPQTFEWISASLGLFLESLVCRNVDLTALPTELSSYLDNAAHGDLLTVMQRLTNTFFRTNSEGLAVYGAGKYGRRSIDLVRRLLLQISQRFIDHKWRPAQWWFDTNAENISQYRFRSFNDTDALEWVDRTQSWWRWEAVKQRNGVTPHIANVQLKALEAPKFSDDHHLEINDINTDVSLNVQVQAAVQSLAHHCQQIGLVSLSGEPISTTLSITPGFVLHNQASLSGVPHSGSQKSFTSNIPYISNLASSLPMFNRDIQHEGIADHNAAPEEITKESRENNKNGPADTWADILDLDSEIDDSGRKTFVSRRKELDFAQNMQLIQMKFVVDPSTENADQYPPIEAWAELPPLGAEDNRRLQEVPRIVAVPLESTAYVSLPNNKADLKVTYSHTYSVPVSESVEQYFMKHCLFGRLGPLDIKPNVDFEFLSEQKVSYKYHSTSYVTLAEVAYDGHMVQFLQSEGGKLGGRKVEVSLVNHSPGLLTHSEISETTEKALNVVSSL